MWRPASRATAREVTARGTHRQINFGLEPNVHDCGVPFFHLQVALAGSHEL